MPADDGPMIGCGVFWCERQNEFEVDGDGTVSHIHRGRDYECGAASVHLEGGFTAGPDGVTSDATRIVVTGVGEDQPLTADDAWLLHLELESMAEMLRAEREGRPSRL